MECVSYQPAGRPGKQKNVTRAKGLTAITDCQCPILKMAPEIRVYGPMHRSLAVLVLAIALAGCWRHASPPAGRWEGTYETSDVMVVARMEVEPNGDVRVSAPDLSDVGGASEDERKGMRASLAAGLAEGWDKVAPRPFDFDGRIFRKPDGIAPQMKWDPDTRTMTLVVYLGTHPAIDIGLRAVDDFSDDPWAG